MWVTKLTKKYKVEGAKLKMLLIDFNVSWFDSRSGVKISETEFSALL